MCGAGLAFQLDGYSSLSTPGREGCGVWILVLLGVSLLVLTAALLLVPPRGSAAITEKPAPERQDGHR
ncbi:hypothetical protein A5748_03950 [Nocardia sp. 852002-51244_SCH5132740]|nr:hypothetical protein A5748_03950 [Nocardia sp. 852002-51244_SCH5132740]